MQKAAEYRAYINYLGNVNNTDNFKKGIDKIITFRNQLVPYYPDFKTEVNQQLQTLKAKKQAAKKDTNAAALEEQISYLEKKLK